MYQKRSLFKNSNWNVDENIVCDTNTIIYLVFSLPIWMSGKCNKMLNKVHDRFWSVEAALSNGFHYVFEVLILQLLKSLKFIINALVDQKYFPFMKLYHFSKVSTQNLVFGQVWRHYFATLFSRFLKEKYFLTYY